MMIPSSRVEELATDVVAAVAMTNGIWTDKISTDLSIALTTLGCIWLIVQIFYKIKNHGKDK